MTKPYEIFAACKGVKDRGAGLTEYWVQIGENGAVWGPYASEELAEEFGRNYTGTPAPTEEQVICPTCQRPITEDPTVTVDPAAERNFFD